jgi:threonyl-tRNA synthetase
MIHRAPFGSLERFVGILIEHFAGAFPLWLAPEQVRVLLVSQKFEEYGRTVEQRMREAGLRASGDYRAEKINAKIRDAQLELIPYMLVIGGREMERRNVSVRHRRQGDLGTMTLEAAIEKLRDEVESKALPES